MYMAEDPSFNHLLPQDYSQKPREQVKYVGQSSAIRHLDPTDHIDASRLKAITESPGALQWLVGPEMSEKDYISWMNDQGSGKNRRNHLFAVSASKGLDDKFKSDNIGEVIGFIYFYSGVKERQQAQRLVDEGLINQDFLDGKRIFEISSAKHPDAPRGIMVGGRMQACLELSRRIQLNEDIDPNKILILAFIALENNKALKSVEKSGFVRIGIVSGYGSDQKPCAAYYLNWDKLHKNMWGNANEALNKPLKEHSILLEPKN